jgi:hypothetical protein
MSKPEEVEIPGFVRAGRVALLLNILGFVTCSIVMMSSEDRFMGLAIVVYGILPLLVLSGVGFVISIASLFYGKSVSSIISIVISLVLFLWIVSIET